MTLKPSYYEQIFNEGIDESVEGLVGMGGVDKLINGEFVHEGGITKRHGFAYPTNNIPSTGSGTGVHTLVANGGTLHVLRKLDGGPVKSDGFYDHAPKSFVMPGHVESVAQLRDGKGFKSANVAVGSIGGRTLACIVGGTGTSKISEVADTFTVTIVDLGTGTTLATTTYTGRRPRPVHRGSTFLWFYEVDNSGWDVKASYWSSNTFNTVSTPYNNGLSFAGSDIAVWPSSTSSSTTYLAWMRDDNTTLYIRAVGETGTVTASNSWTVDANTDIIAMCQGEQNNTILHVMYGDASNLGTGSAVKVFSTLADLTGTTSSAVQVFAAPSSGYVWSHLAVSDLGSAGGTALVCVGAQANNTVNVTAAKVAWADMAYTMGASVTSGYSVTRGATINNTLLLGHPLTAYPDDTTNNNAATPLLLLSRYSDVPLPHATPEDATSIPNSYLQCLPFGTHFNTSAPLPVPGGFGSSHGLLAATGVVGGAFQGMSQRTGVALNYNHAAPSFFVRDSSNQHYYTAQLELEVLNGTRDIVYGIRVLRYSFSTTHANTKPLPRASLGGLTYLGGNQLRSFDGQVVGEAVPLYPPPLPTFANTAGGSLDADATYGFSYVWVWEDRKGLVHRSAPTPPTTTTTAGANRTITHTWSSDDVFPTALNEVTAVRNVRIEVYRTEGGGTTYQFEQSSVVTEGSSLVLTSSGTDASISSNKFIYTTGNVLANEHPPAPKALAAVGNRLFALSAVDPRVLYFSKELEEGFAAEFNGVLSTRVEASESEPVALAGLGDLLVIFTKREAWAISTHGGPDATGAGTFGLPERLATDCGASSPEAAVSTPLGVLVHGPAGFRMLTPGGAVDVPALTDTAPGTAIVRRAMHVPEREEVWYLFQSGTTYRIIVFSYRRGKLRWMFWDVTASGVTLAIRDMVSVDGTPYIVVHNGTTYKLMLLSTTSYLDAGTEFVAPVVRNRWFKPDGHLGDSRFWRWHLFGTYGQGGFTVKVYVMDVDGSPDDDDGESFLRGTWTFTPSQLESGDTRVIHIRNRLRDQRGAAARLEITWTADVGTPDARGPILHAVGWDFGTRQGQSAQRAASFEGT